MIRPEGPQDAPAIATLITEAFLTAAHADGNEAEIVARLRAEGGLLLSLVSEGPNGIQGHIAASPCSVGGQTGWACIAPLAVDPAQQRSGIGTALVGAALAQFRRLSVGGVVIVGDPAYYGRFGFAADPAIFAPDIPPDYVLTRRCASTAAGALRFHAAFGLD